MLDIILNNLWNNWMFRLSLSSNELFHSNFLQIILSDPLLDVNDERVGVTSWARVRQLGVWAGLDDAWVEERQAEYEGCQVFVYREWKRLDLAIVVREPRGQQRYREVVIFAVELKIKSYPTLEQVIHYLEAMEDNNEPAPFVPKLVLLSMVQPQLLFENLENVTMMNFEQLADGIEQINPFQPNLQPAIEEYTRLCRLLNEVSQFWSNQLSPDTPLNAVTGMTHVYRRLNPIWSKLCAGYLCELVRTKMENFVPHENIELQTIPNFSNATWSADFLWCTHQNNPAGGLIPNGVHQVIAKVGVQVEGDTLRFMLNAQNVGNGIDNARLIVEETLFSQAVNSGLYKRLHERYEINEVAPEEQVEQVRLFWARMGGIRLDDNGLPLLSLPIDQEVYRLTGYRNGPTFGHADYRLRLNQDATLNQISELIAAALRGEYNDNAGDAFLQVLTDPATFEH